MTAKAFGLAVPSTLLARADDRTVDAFFLQRIRRVVPEQSTSAVQRVRQFAGLQGLRARGVAIALKGVAESALLHLHFGTECTQQGAVSAHQGSMPEA